MVRKAEREGLDARADASVVQLLFKAARLANERAVARVNAESGAPVFRESMARLLPHLRPEGVRVVDLARKLDVSKQAVSKTVGEFLALGLLEQVKDPADARSRKVRLSPKGYEALAHGLGVLEGLGREFEAALGAPRVKALHEALRDVVALLERAPAG